MTSLTGEKEKRMEKIREFSTSSETAAHYGTKPGHFETLNHSLSLEQGGELSETASE